MKVKLLRYTKEGEKLVSSAAKLCYSPVGIDQIESNLTEENINSFLKMLVNMGHESPLEHISYTFAIEGVSRSLTHQLVRHRIASYSQQSQRYVKFDQFEYVIPPSINKNKKAKNLFIKSMEEAQKNYDDLVELLTEDYIRDYNIDNLNDKKLKIIKREAEKKAIEDARYVFPNACETKIVCTMNARTLLNFFNLRCCNRAQWEIRFMAIEMLRLVKEKTPIIFENTGPVCLTGPCPEGNMSCGEIEEVRKYFRNEV